ncbi:response regulator [Luteibacter yeojuensis]|uniref:histidine kinase n=1 Tax=Luteibacter yeojuensis TaxID=345309 RepID=A0A0F3KME1_9GAMM|nr:response regulator [Luteibacter yeojuensis]KJV31279.1 hydrogenase expression protein HupH [Luteibacter yeojuensis]
MSTDLSPSIRILLLEDSALDAELIEVQLNAASLAHVTERVWTLEAFEAALGEHRHDVILSDHLLRGFDGHDALVLARRFAPDVPFIFVSGTLSEELAVDALKKGARDYVVKQRLQRLPDAIVRAQKESRERQRLAVAESELRESRQQLLLMADALPALIAHVGTDGRYRFGNDAHLHWFGVGPDALPGLSVADVLGEDAFATMESALTGVRMGDRRSVEVRLAASPVSPARQAQIDLVPEQNDDGIIVGYYMLARDITELKRAEALLRESNSNLQREVRDRTEALAGSQKRLAALFESSFQLQVMLDLEGRVIDANRAFTSAILSERADLVGQPIVMSAFFAGSPGVGAEISGSVTRAASGQASKHEMELALPTGKRSFEVSVRPLFDMDGLPGALVIEAVETTARRLAEQALRQSQKIEAIGQLTGGIAHDFNNILTIIAGSAELAKIVIERLPGAERASRALDNTLKGVSSAASLTHRLLAFARRQPLRTEAVNCNQQVLGMEDMLRRTLGELVQLKLLTSPNLWNVEVDASQLEAAVLNLAVNARDAMPEGGTLTIEVSNTHVSDADAAALPEANAGDHVMVRVRDTGAGMSEETLARVLEPFFTTKEVGRGTGLGLPMVYGFVKQSRGQLILASEPGAGTSVTMLFPRTNKAVAHADFVVAPVVDAMRHSATVLVAEDNDDVRAYVVEVLREVGYRVLEAHDGPAALRLLERSDVTVDMLFSDIVMPAMSGWDLAQKARQIHPHLRVLFASGYPRNVEDNEHEIRNVGLLSKPFTRSELTGAVASVLEKPALVES